MRSDALDIRKDGRRNQMNEPKPTETKEAILFKKHPIIIGLIVAVASGLIVALFTMKYQEEYTDYKEEMFSPNEITHDTNIKDAYEPDSFETSEEKRDTEQPTDSIPVTDYGESVVFCSQISSSETNPQGHILRGQWIRLENDELIYDEWEGGSINISGAEYIYLNLFVMNMNPDENVAANNTRTYFEIPNETGSRMIVRGCVSASNSEPKEQWDDLEVFADRDFSLEYITGSAYMYNNYYGFWGKTADYSQRLADRIVVSPGAFVGYVNPDGIVKGGEQYSLAVSVKLKVLWE